MRDGCQWLVVMVAAVIGFSAWAQPAPAADLAADRAALQKRLLDLERQMREIRHALANEPELAGLAKALETARQARDRKYDAPALARARQARDQSRLAAEQALVSAIAADVEGAAALRRIDSARQAAGEAARRQGEAEEALRALHRTFVKDPALAHEAQRVALAEAAYRETAQTDPALVAAARSVAAARAALEARIRDLPEQRALDAALKAQERALADSPALQAAREAREAAGTALDEAALAKARATPEGAALLHQQEEQARQVQQHREARQLAQQQVSDLRRRLRPTPAIADAARQAEAADAAYQRLRQAELQAEDAALQAAREAHEQQLAEKLASHPRAASLKEQIDELTARLRAMPER